MTAGELSVPAVMDGPLHGGTANRGLVVRVGHTVRRPAAPCRAATHALLAHLAAAGFDGSPRVLAADATTDTLTYIEGRAAAPPLLDEMLTDTALVSIAELLRRYHEAAASFDPAGYRWPRRIPARFTTGLVSHNDVYPANFGAGRWPRRSWPTTTGTAPSSPRASTRATKASSTAGTRTATR